ncbi:GNAT family N-acetyltransferase [Senegalia massiliensis]|uniref:GNAT family N-acetyltransferase n=1 Tax=Senegalia massiliensis TaxID=1720316 RepID=A0A845QSW9_9CLOT|nr:GNAT family N-acetyltransferase [Senegalia massiliensis]NBI05917.1 GNAT family N-acetyltransferase [Senegalia massiliensis]
MEWIIKTYDELTKDELYEILKKRIDVFVVEQNCPYDEIDNRDKDSYHIFLKKDMNVIAYLRILEPGISFENISIGRVLVDKNQRGNGLAIEMMNKAIDFIINNLRYNIIRISAQEYLIGFYENLGFEKVSNVYLEDDIPHVEMVYQNYKK